VKKSIDRKKRREAAWKARLALPRPRRPARRHSSRDRLERELDADIPSEHGWEGSREDLESDLRKCFGLLWSTATLKENLASDLLDHAGCSSPLTSAQRAAAYRALYAESKALLDPQNAKLDDSAGAERLCSAIHRALDSYPQDARDPRKERRTLL